jgi:hypothetical protein
MALFSKAIELLDAIKWNAITGTNQKITLTASYRF